MSEVTEKIKTSYMNTIFKNKILTGAMFVVSLLLGTSCNDSIEGLKVTEETPYADKTLYEVLTKDPQLTDFVEVLNSCGAECADSLFNHSRVYTVWVPLNDTFNKDSLILEVENGNRESVFNTFIKAHIANYLKPATGKLDETNLITLLNDKMAKFEGDYSKGYTFDGCVIDRANIRVMNGIMHKIAKASEYKYNVWEYLGIAENLDSLANYLYSFTEYKFDENKSIKGPIVDGVQTYLDSTFYYSNIWLKTEYGIGLLDALLDAEDSLYTVYYPTNDVWMEQLEKIDRFYNYNKEAKRPLNMDTAYRDSLRSHYTHLNILKYLTFSDKEQRFVKNSDSIMPAYKRGKRVEFLKAQLEENVISEKTLSNGTFKIVDKYPYTPLEICHDTIFLEAENTNMLTNHTGNISVETKYVYDNEINKDSAFVNSKVSGGAYHQFGQPTQRNAITVEYTIPNLLSAKYNIAVVFVPRNIKTNVSASDLLDSQVDLTLMHNGKTVKSVKKLDVDGARLDTVFLTEKDARLALDIPFCEYYLTGNNQDYTTKLQIKTNTGAKLDKSLRIDKIMFIPVLDEE